MASKNPASRVIDRVVRDLQRAEKKAVKSTTPNVGEEPPTRSERARSPIAPIMRRLNIHRDAFKRHRPRNRNG